MRPRNGSDELSPIRAPVRPELALGEAVERHATRSVDLPLSTSPPAPCTHGPTYRTRVHSSELAVSLRVWSFWPCILCNVLQRVATLCTVTLASTVTLRWQTLRSQTLDRVTTDVAATVTLAPTDPCAHYPHAGKKNRLSADDVSRETSSALSLVCLCPTASVPCWPRRRLTAPDR